MKERRFHLLQRIFYLLIILFFSIVQAVQILTIDFPLLRSPNRSLDIQFYGLILLLLPLYILVFFYLPTLILIQFSFCYPFKSLFFIDRPQKALLKAPVYLENKHFIFRYYKVIRC